MAERPLIAGGPTALGAPALHPDPVYMHRLALEFEMTEAEVLDLIAGASRLKMAVRGWVAEHHLVQSLSALTGVSSCERLEGDGLPDVRLRFMNGPPITVECKNVLRKGTDGVPRVDFQRTRASLGDPCSRFYAPDDFDVLAACLHARTERWEYCFILPSSLPRHKRCPDKLATNVQVGTGWVSDAALVLKEASAIATRR